MRLRTDSAHVAGWKRAHALRGCACPPDEIATSLIPPEERPMGSVSHVAHDPQYAPVERAETGDVWRMALGDGRVVGYALTCPLAACPAGVHLWSHAADCGADRNAHLSCWTWSGSPEDGTLTASPSLWVQAERGGCGWHGYLRNGEMVAV